MGMYTEFFFRAELTENQQAEQAVDMLRNAPRLGTTEFEHPFFHCPRWTMLLFGGSAYHPTRGFDCRREENEGPVLFIHSSFKNYDDEIVKFLDWIDPLVAEPQGTFLGYSLYENDCKPTLYYKKG